MDYAKFRLRNFTTLKSYYILLCGSSNELPLKYREANPTDLDAIFYFYDICAIPCNRNPPKNTRCTVLRIDSKQTPPGFAKLMFDRDNTEDNPTYLRRPPHLRDIKTGGPSWTHEKRLTPEGRALRRVNHDTVIQDRVFAVYCPYWPTEAEEWRKRQRFHGWPNEKLIARITRGGCHFVSKLRTWSSSCDDTEWRFSFSKAELLLIHSWTPEQKLAYHVIRLIKRRIAESCGGAENKGLQTYYFKTLMLWACEEYPKEFWSEQNLNNWLPTLLHRFFRCLYDKFCPSYFIPVCNTMSHLKDEDCFEKELQTLQMFLTNKTVIDVDICPSLSVSVPNNSFEYCSLKAVFVSCPLNEEINGRCAQYLFECEWFLPQMRNLHTAIEAHLRLMSVDSVTQRQTSKDYVVCVENFEFVLLKREESEPFEIVNADKTNPENWIRNFVRKLLRNPVVVYRRENYRDLEFVNTITELYPSMLQCATSAYRANFYFTAMQSYNESLRECEIYFGIFKRTVFGFEHRCMLQVYSYVPILICNSLSQIFDGHLQVILGFATLLRNISFSNSSIIATSHEVCLRLDAWEFLRYIYMQCHQKVYPAAELIYYTLSDHCHFFRPYVSQLIDNPYFSAVILFSALRQSKAYKNPFRFP